MIAVAAALELILEYRQDFGTELIPLAQASGRVLAEEIFADRDFPPFNRVTMDGIAIDSNAIAAGKTGFTIENIQAAGQPQLKLNDPGNCIEIMTGAVLPAGTDTVVPYEDCSIQDGIAVIEDMSAISAGQNIHFKGTDGKKGDLLLAPFSRITPAAVGIIASVGKDRVLVKKLPRIAICSTGDELVAIQASPAQHQIRRSNSYMLAAALNEEGIEPDTYHLQDDPAKMRLLLESMMKQYDVLLFSGAVSKGKYDFLPSVLEDLQLNQVFHRVAQKPGKPLLFGRLPQGTIVFGFPGNPVSTLVCYHVFFLDWLKQSLQLATTALTARLSTPVHFKPALTYHLLVTLAVKDGLLEATPCAGANSGDMLSLEQAAAVITLPADRQSFEKGESFPLLMITRFPVIG